MNTLQDVFNAVIADQQVCIEVNKKSYESLRVSLLRKYKAYVDQCQSVGLPAYDDKYLSCQFDGANGMATFQLRWREESKRVRGSYRIFSL